MQDFAVWCLVFFQKENVERAFCEKKKGAFADKEMELHLADVFRDEREIKLMSSKGRKFYTEKTQKYFDEK